MRNGNERSRLSRFVLAAALYSSCFAVYGQESSSVPVPEPESAGWRRFSFGGRLNGLPFNVLNNHDVNFNVAATNQAWAITTSNNYLQIAFGPSLEVRVTQRFALCGEFLYHRLNYTKTSTATVDGNVTTITEQTRATLLGRSADGPLPGAG